MFRILFLVFFFALANSLFAHNNIFNSDSSIRSDSIEVKSEKSKIFLKKSNSLFSAEFLEIQLGRTCLRIKLKHVNERITAAALVILTGLVGGHRLYLGTSPVVPAAYAVTMGGGFGLIPAVDLLFILFSKDIEDFKDNQQIFMWSNRL
ncbi:MAG: hypothetical protein C0594_17850 [Marinilabiliales bacterium]|nr:MAG: hypothetical protein C0594_17850 [Marinilabiliales bacterium]